MKMTKKQQEKYDAIKLMYDTYFKTLGNARHINFELDYDVKPLWKDEELEKFKTLKQCITVFIKIEEYSQLTGMRIFYGTAHLFISYYGKVSYYSHKLKHNVVIYKRQFLDALRGGDKK